MDRMNDLASAIDENSSNRRRNKIKVYCCGGKKCGKPVREGDERCPKKKGSHQLNWDDYSCTHCDSEFDSDDDPLWFKKCPECGVNLLGAVANHYGVVVH